MNLAALNVYETIRSTGTQRDAIPSMQTRDDMYEFLDYYAYEQKLDELFKEEQELMTTTNTPKTKRRSRSPASSPATPRSARSDTATICATAATTSATWRRTPSSKKSPTSCCTAKLPTRAELANYKSKLRSLRGLPAVVRTVLEQIPAAAHPMDVMHAGVAALSTA